ncbi:BQ5605_C006g04117 [Microbotryum silenes-dioicae]|uniref:BQ5605_C006g04117 protein n=1 Tax=Microbotryum silenes-dioicae TaxID=796604 RepID=A0A2X0P1V8_9BASI|nr:BQ5605_C006g04117 [Microbotryum silenes-dioicae]
MLPCALLLKDWHTPANTTVTPTNGAVENLPWMQSMSRDNSRMQCHQLTVKKQLESCSDVVSSNWQWNELRWARCEEQEGERWRSLRLSLNWTHRMLRKAVERHGVKPKAEGHVPGCFDGKWNLGERRRNGLSLA